METIKSVIFDLDGVLVETIHLKAQAHAAIIRSYGGNVEDGFYTHVIGLSHEETRAAYIQAGDVQIDPEKYTQHYRQTLSELSESKLRLTPGILPLIRMLSKGGLSMAVVTSSPRRFLNHCLELTGVSRFFDVRISADDVRNKKPSPDPYIRAIEKLSTPNNRAIVIEDSIPGMESANLAGLPVMIIRHQYNRLQHFSDAASVFDYPIDATLIFQAIMDFRSE